MAKKKKYVAVFDRDESGWWVVTVRGVKGPLTQARSIGQGKARIREALSLFVDDADEAEILVEVKMSTAEKAAIARARAMQHAAEHAQLEAAQAVRKVVRGLVGRMSIRDAAEVMGISGGRIHQLVEAGK